MALTTVSNAGLGGSIDLTAKVTGTLPIANGGTNSTSTTFVNAASNVTGTLPIANGGTAATTFAAAGLANTPAVLATSTAGTSCANATNVQMTLDVETIDTDSAFASNTFTVPTGKAGMYWIAGRAEIVGPDAGEFIQMRVYLNGVSNGKFENRETSDSTDEEFKFSFGGSLDLAEADTIKLYAYQNSGETLDINQPALWSFRVIGA